MAGLGSKVEVSFHAPAAQDSGADQEQSPVHASKACTIEDAQNFLAELEVGTIMVSMTF